MFTSILNRRQQHRPTLIRHIRHSRPKKRTKLDCRRKNRASKFASGCEYGDTNAVFDLIKNFDGLPALVQRFGCDELCRSSE